jgi:hypothetical protein
MRSRDALRTAIIDGVGTVLIELPGGAGILRGEDGEIALTHDVRIAHGQVLQPSDRYQPIRLGLRDDRMLVGGLLPPGAVSAEAVEATGVRTPAGVGGGAYAVIFEDGEHGEPALGYRDAASQFVHRPLPADYPHAPIADAEEPCVVCGEIQYEQYLVTEEWRAGRGRKGTDSFQRSPLIVCRVCGHQEHVSAISRFGGTEHPDEDEATREARLARARAAQAVQRWYSNKMTLTAAAFVIYAAEGWPARVNGDSSENGETTSVRIAHADPLPDAVLVARPRIEIITSVEARQPAELTLACGEFGRMAEADGHRELGEDLSDAAVTLWFRAARRRRVSGAHHAPVGQTEIMIDGEAEPFVTVGSPNARWVAVRRHCDVTITIVGREIDPASLVIEPIADPNARLLGPEPVES